MASTTNHQSQKSPNTDGEPFIDDILRAIRRILRKTAEHSRQLARDGDLSISELLCLRQLAKSTKAAPVSVAEVAAAVQLSNATVSRMLERLVAAELIVRERGTLDRRKVFLWLTPRGTRRLKKLPTPLHEQFVERLMKLRKSEQRSLLAALEQIVDMMGAANLDAAPVLTPEADVKASARP